MLGGVYIVKIVVCTKILYFGFNLGIDSHSIQQFFLRCVASSAPEKASL